MACSRARTGIPDYRNRRWKHTRYWRDMAIYFCHIELELEQTHIARAYRRHPSTVSYTIYKVATRLNTDPVYMADYCQLIQDMQRRWNEAPGPTYPGQDVAGPRP